VLEAVTLAGVDDGRAHLGRGGAGQLGEIDLEAGERVGAHLVQTHAQLAETQLLQLGLEAADLRETLARDGGSIRDAARQAGRGGLVPDRQLEAGGGGADVGLGELGLDQREADAVLAGGVEAGAIVAEIVDDDPRGDEGDAAGFPLALGHRVELGLAVEAAVGAVLRVAGVVDLVRVDELVAGADGAGDGRRLFALAGGQAGAHGGDADGAVAEHLRCDEEQERAVDAAREAHEHRAHVGDHGAEAVELRVDGGGVHAGTRTTRRPGHHVSGWRGRARRRLRDRG
jgi:hypothetical protein